MSKKPFWEILCAAIVFLQVSFLSVNVLAQQGDASTFLPKDTAKFIPSISFGVMSPNEGSLDWGPQVGFGFRYTDGSDGFFGDFLYAPTDLDITVTGVSRADNFMFQFGYIRDIRKLDGNRVGFGLQVHKMDFQGADREMSELAFVGLFEHDFGKRWTLRVQDSFGGKEEGIHFGSISATIIYSF